MPRYCAHSDCQTMPAFGLELKKATQGIDSIHALYYSMRA